MLDPLRSGQDAEVAMWNWPSSPEPIGWLLSVRPFRSVNEKLYCKKGKPKAKYDVRNATKYSRYAH